MVGGWWGGKTASLRVSSCLSQGLGFLSLLLIFFSHKALLVPAYKKKITNTRTHTHVDKYSCALLHPSHWAIFVWTGLRSSRKALSDVLK